MGNILIDNSSGRIKITTPSKNRKINNKQSTSFFRINYLALPKGYTPIVFYSQVKWERWKLEKYIIKINKKYFFLELEIFYRNKDCFQTNYSKN